MELLSAPIVSNPNGLVSAPIGSLFYRRDDRYFLIDGITQLETEIFTLTRNVFFRKQYNPDFNKKRFPVFSNTIETWFRAANVVASKGWIFISNRSPVIEQPGTPPTPTPSMVPVSPTPTPSMVFVSPTPTMTVTPYPTSTPTPSITVEPPQTPTVTTTPSAMVDPTPTPTITVTPTAEPTPTPTVTNTPTPSMEIPNMPFGLGGGQYTFGMIDPSDTSSLEMRRGTADYKSTYVYGDGVILSLNSNTYPYATFDRSIDGGLSWTHMVLTGSLPYTQFYNGAYGDGRFIVIGDYDTLITSTDGGATWSILETSFNGGDYAPSTSTGNGKNAAYSGIIFVNGRFIVTRGWIDISPDSASIECYIGKYTDDGGSTWTNMNITSQSYSTSSMITFAPLNGSIAYGNGTLCVIGPAKVYKYASETGYPFSGYFASQSAIISTDLGETWSDISPVEGLMDNVSGFSMRSIASWSSNRLAYGNGRFVSILGYSETSSIFYSDDGLHWSSTQISKSYQSSVFSSVRYNDGKFILLSEYSQRPDDMDFRGYAYYESTDGANWTEKTYYGLVTVQNVKDILVFGSPISESMVKVPHNRSYTRPSNDRVTSSIELTEFSGTITASTVGATRDPNYITSAAYNSIWWKFTETENRFRRFSTSGSNFSNYINAFKDTSVDGVVPTMSFIATGFTDHLRGNLEGYRGDIAFNTVSGSTYYVNVGSYDSAWGDVVLTYTSSTLVDVPNTSMETAISLTGSEFHVSGDGIKSNVPRWYSWIPEMSGVCRMSASFDPIFKGQSYFFVIPSGSSDTSASMVRFNVSDVDNMFISTGSKYYIAISGSCWEGTFELDVVNVGRIQNDSVSSASRLVSYPTNVETYVTGSTIGSTDDRYANVFDCWYVISSSTAGTFLFSLTGSVSGSPSGNLAAEICYGTSDNLATYPFLKGSRLFGTSSVGAFFVDQNTDFLVHVYFTSSYGTLVPRFGDFGFSYKFVEPTTDGNQIFISGSPNMPMTYLFEESHSIMRNSGSIFNNTSAKIYSVISPSNGVLTLSLTGSSPMYTNVKGGMDGVRLWRAGGGTSGSSYRIPVTTGYSPSFYLDYTYADNVRFEINFTPSAVNIDTASAWILTGSSGHVDATTRYSGVLYWKYSPDTDGTFIISSSSLNGLYPIKIFKSPNMYNHIGWLANHTIAAPMISGSTYYLKFGADPTINKSGSFEYNLIPSDKSENYRFDLARIITGSNVSSSGYNWSVTSESIDGGLCSNWYKWSPDENGVVYAEAHYNSIIDGVYELKSGSALLRAYEIPNTSEQIASNLREVYSDRFIAKTGSMYYFNTYMSYVGYSSLPTITMSLVVDNNRNRISRYNTSFEKALWVSSSNDSYNYDVSANKELDVDSFWWKFVVAEVGTGVNVSCGGLLPMTTSIQAFRTSGSTVDEQWNNLSLMGSSSNGLYVTCPVAGETIYIKCDPSIDRCSLGYCYGNISLSAPLPPEPSPLPAPVNDSRTSATILDVVSGSDTVNTSGATADPTDPSPLSTKKSVWWRWSPPVVSSGTATVSTLGSNFDTILYAYRLETGGTLTQLAYNDDYSGTTSQVTFTVDSGSVYYLGVGGYSTSDSGTVILNYSV